MVVGKVTFKKTFAVRQHKTHDKGTCLSCASQRPTTNFVSLLCVFFKRTAKVNVRESPFRIVIVTVSEQGLSCVGLRTLSCIVLKTHGKHSRNYA
jgi:hypothetical protein